MLYSQSIGELGRLGQVFLGMVEGGIQNQEEMNGWEFLDDDGSWWFMMVDDVDYYIPVVPHKAVAEVSRIGNV